MDCGQMSGPADTDYTLINAAHGWRATRLRNDAGQIVTEWRCAACWRARKERGETARPSRRPPAPPSAEAAGDAPVKHVSLLDRVKRRFGRSR